MKKVLAFALIYSIAAPLLIQLIVLPKFLPAWHWGEGLLKAGDFVGLHLSAVWQSERIRQLGWSEWQLRPEPSHAIESGIASAIYALSIPKPWALIPWNALVHLATALCLFGLFYRLSNNRRWSVLAVFPFFFLPTSLSWLSQLHKDGLSLLGMALFLTGWCRLFDGGKGSLVAVMGLIAGTTFTRLTRPYLITVLILVSALFTVYHLWITLRRQEKAPVALGLLGLLCVILPAKIDFSRVAQILGEAPKSKVPSSIGEAPKSKIPSSIEEAANSPHFAWQKNFPSYLDSRFYSMALTRDGYLRYTTARSNIDVEQRFHSAMELLSYAPRALQISLFAPFPTFWSQETDEQSSILQRRIVILEMALSYLFFPFFLASLFYFRRSHPFWGLIFFCFFFLWLYGTSVPNLGTLHRFRYLFFSLILGLGILSVPKTLGSVTK